MLLTFMNRAGHVVTEIAKNALMGVPVIRRWRSRHGRTTTSDQARQISDQFAFFIGTLGDVRGKTVIEVGPGDAAALGALFLKEGTGRYIAYDRFAGDITGPQAKALYAALGCIGFDDKVIMRGAIEDADSVPEADIVISFDALEHVRDPHLALRKMAALLKPSGVMVHRVDYSAHDIWRSYDEDLFLRFPRWLWNLMGSNRGYPNRVRHAAIAATIRALGFQLHERVTRRFANGDVLLAEFTCGKVPPPLGPMFPY